MAAAGKRGTPLSAADTHATMQHGMVSNCLDEVREIISLPEFDCIVAKHQTDPMAIDLSENVRKQMHAYVSCIANMYRENHFHSK